MSNADGPTPCDQQSSSAKTKAEFWSGHEDPIGTTQTSNLTVIKSVTQRFSTPKDLLPLQEIFRLMTNDCIRIGLAANVSTLKRLSLMSYNELKRYDCPSYYKLSAISRAAGILASRVKSIRRGMRTRSPYAVRPMLTTSYGFVIENGSLKIPFRKRERYEVPLNNHTLDVLSGESLRVRSFTLTDKGLSIAFSRSVKRNDFDTTCGLDRNLRNLTYGNETKVIHYDMSRAVKIAKTTNEIVSSFRRNDVRIRKRIASKYGTRWRSKSNHLLHCATKRIVERASLNREAIVIENIEGIRALYRRGNRQGAAFRGMMNTWAFSKAQRQIEYKAAWNGVTVIHLTKDQTRGTSRTCYRCGERLQDSREKPRRSWCPRCKTWTDRDVVAVVNQARRGRLTFDRSLPKAAKGEAVEAVTRNVAVAEPLILRVDASKLTQREAYASL